MASFPTSVPSFPTRAEGQTFFADHINDLQDEVVAIATQLLATAATSFTSPLTVKGDTPVVVLDPGAGTVKTRLVLLGRDGGYFDWTVNATPVGGGWFADDVSKASLMLRLTGATGRLVLYHAPAGASARTFTEVWSVTPPGRVQELRRAVEWMGEWRDYTPTWQSSGGWPTLGNGSIYGRYAVIGKTVHARIALTLGSTSVQGSGAWYFGVPVVSAAAGESVVGTARGFCAGNNYNLIPVQQNANNVQCLYHGGFGIGAGAPGAWVSGGNVHLELIYNHP